MQAPARTLFNLNIVIGILLLVGYQNLAANYSQPLKIGFWSTWKIPCGIAMYTQHLKGALWKRGCLTFVYPHDLPIDVLIRRILSDDLHLLNIQYEIGMMPPTSVLLATINKVKNKGVKVIITIHDEPSFAQELLDAADFCIYHKPPAYITENAHKVIRLPMGVPVFNPPPPTKRSALKKKYGFSPTSTIITTTGFLLVTKQLSLILNLLAPRLKSRPSFGIQLITPFTPRNIKMCSAEYAKVKKALDDNNLWNQVQLITKFIPQKELSERLWISDVGYQWFNVNTKANSGAAREFISARTPLVVPRCSHYDLLTKGVIKTPMDAKRFVDEIFKLLDNKEKRKQLQKEMEHEYTQLNYDTLSKQYITVYKKCLNFH